MNITKTLVYNNIFELFYLVNIGNLANNTAFKFL